MLLSVLTDRRGETDSESLKLATFVCATECTLRIAASGVGREHLCTK